MTDVLLRNLTRRFGDSVAVNNLNLEIKTGELVAFLGPSGCGKTTTLRMITGLLLPSDGDVLFDGKSMLTVPTEKRGAVMVFQKHLLFPTMNVGQNVGFGLRMQGVDQKEIDRLKFNQYHSIVTGGYQIWVGGKCSGTIERDQQIGAIPFFSIHRLVRRKIPMRFKPFIKYPELMVDAGI